MKDWKEWKDNFCQHISNWSYFSAEEELEKMNETIRVDERTKLLAELESWLVDEDDNMPYSEPIIRNNLRAELRAKLQEMRGGEIKDSLNNPFWRYKITFDIKNKRMWQEGVINEPIDENEAKKMLFENVGLINNPKIVYLTKGDSTPPATAEKRHKQE